MLTLLQWPQQSRGEPGFPLGYQPQQPGLFKKYYALFASKSNSSEELQITVMFYSHYLSYDGLFTFRSDS